MKIELEPEKIIYHLLEDLPFGDLFYIREDSDRTLYVKTKSFVQYRKTLNCVSVSLRDGRKYCFEMGTEIIPIVEIKCKTKND